jgi:hypothetical protein
MVKRMCMIAAACGAAVILPALAARPALAHEARKVGNIDLEVGWGTEPAYAGTENSVQLLLGHGGQPVTDLGDSLKVEVSFGDQTQEFPIEPFFDTAEGLGTPGDYRAWLIPTRAGSYSFHFTGTIEGQNVDETFTSGPKTFADVDDPQSVQFPVQDPSTGELAARIAREVPRINDSIDAANASAHNASDDASSAKTFAIIGIAVGAIGLAVAIVALVSTRRKRA